MKYITLSLLIIVSIPLFSASSCERKNDNTKDKSPKCPPNTICTMMFAAVNTQVKDKAGASIVFDEVYTLRESNNEIIKYEQRNTNGSYTVLDDSYRSEIENTSDNFRLVGKMNGQTVMNELFVIKADCCHVSKVSGKSEIVID